jgi:hypothetical protein
VGRHVRSNGSELNAPRLRALTNYLPYPVEVRHAGSKVNFFSLALGSGWHLFRMLGTELWLSAFLSAMPQVMAAFHTQEGLWGF